VWNHYEGDTAEDNEYVCGIAISALSIQFPKKALLLKSLSLMCCIIDISNIFLVSIEG
jgi:hypothetical protein